jgi:hypothetical protein
MKPMGAKMRACASLSVVPVWSRCGREAVPNFPAKLVVRVQETDNTYRSGAGLRFSRVGPPVRTSR